jgi:hypothetical protein
VEPLAPTLPPVKPPSPLESSSLEDWVTKWRAVVLWILRKAQGREKARRWCVTKTWLNGQPDLPKKEDFDFVWKKLIASRYGKMEKTTFVFNPAGQELASRLESR